MKIDYISIKEFREKGYLQELNRTFLHPLGLALEVEVDENGNESLGGIWDYRNDKGGIYYNLKESDISRQVKFDQNRIFIEEQLEKRLKDRVELLGFDIEPISFENYTKYKELVKELESFSPIFDGYLYKIEKIKVRNRIKIRDMARLLEFIKNNKKEKESNS